MNNIIFPQTDLSFQVYQIICLEHQDTCLYGEAIQINYQRQLCWFRPLFLTTNYARSQNTLANDEVIDLRSSSDLLLPICLFRPSLDTEVISLLSQFGDLDDSPKDSLVSSRCLNQFVQKVWQANKDKF